MAKQQKEKPSLDLTPFIKAHEKVIASITFRPGSAFGLMLETFIAQYPIDVEKKIYLTRGEASKRLAVMSVKGFNSALHYYLLAQIAELIGGRESFTDTCMRVTDLLCEQAKIMGKFLSQELITLQLQGMLLELQKQDAQQEQTETTERVT